MVPDQHAAFGIAKATKETREPIWRDLGLAELVAGNGATADGEGSRAMQDGPMASEGGIGGVGTANASRSGVAAVGPATGGVRIPMGVRAGMRTVGSGIGSDLRG